MPALLTRMCSGRSQSAVNARTESWSDRSRALTDTAPLPVSLMMPAAISFAACGRRTASVTSAPADARARAVSMPMPDPAPVTIAVFPCRSTPSITSEAVEVRLNGVCKSCDMTVPLLGVRARLDRAVSLCVVRGTRARTG